MKKQTAVEWLKLQLETYGDPQYCELTWKELDELCEQAKEMEREQMIKLISFVRMHNKMGKSANDLLEEFETYKGGSNE